MTLGSIFFLLFKMWIWVHWYRFRLILHLAVVSLSQPYEKEIKLFKLYQHYVWDNKSPVITVGFVIIITLSAGIFPLQYCILWRILFKTPQSLVRNHHLDPFRTDWRILCEPLGAWDLCYIFLCGRYLQVPGRPQLSLAPGGKNRRKSFNYLHEKWVA